MKAGDESLLFFCAKSNSAKICISKSLEYNKGRNKKKRIQKAEMQKELQRFESSVLIHWRYAFTKFSSFLCLAGPVAMIWIAAGFVVS